MKLQLILFYQVSSQTEDTRQTLNLYVVVAVVNLKTCIYKSCKLATEWGRGSTNFFNDNAHSLTAYKMF